MDKKTMKLKNYLDQLRYFYRIFSIRGSLLRRLSRLRRAAGEMRSASPTPSLPVRLQVETTDICNLKCTMCAREVLPNMNTGYMALEQFEKLIEAASPYYVTLNGLGEPLTDKSIFDKLSMLHDKLIITSMPTNGTFVFGDRLTNLAKHLPDRLCFSIDGGKKDTFEKIRRQGDFTKIIENYKNLSALRSQGKTRKNQSIYILMALQKINMHDYQEMFTLYESMTGVDSISLIPVTDYGVEGESLDVCPSKEEVLILHKEIENSIANSTSENEKAFFKKWKHASSKWLVSTASGSIDAATNNHACLLPWFSSYVDAKGRVYPCCYLTNSDHVMGNINDEPFEKLWHGETYQTFRKQLAEDRPNLSSCRNCPRNDDRRIDLFKKLGPLLP